jgi:hypothetical protein
VVARQSVNLNVSPSGSFDFTFRPSGHSVLDCRNVAAPASAGAASASTIAPARATSPLGDSHRDPTDRSLIVVLPPVRLCRRLP